MATVNVGTIDVYLIALQPDGWRVLTLQRSLTTRCPTAWETVHGRIEQGEEPEQTAVREVR
jgi:8-oxo-dGTP pyrophosphatase MutT (NUDIX family)